ncbi:RNA-dependent RNA polymerase, partial [Reticulomyxa filosa]
KEEGLDFAFIQCILFIRFGGCKGVVVRSNCEKDLLLRPSMIKFDLPQGQDLMFEVCRSSSFSPCYLNRQAITLFETLDNAYHQVIYGIAKEALDKFQDIKQNKRHTVQFIHSRMHKKDLMSPLYTLHEIVDNGFSLDTPFVQFGVDVEFLFTFIIIIIIIITIIILLIYFFQSNSYYFNMKFTTDVTTKEC